MREVIVAPETILDLYLEFGMPEDLYKHLSAILNESEKLAIAELTLESLEFLSGEGLSLERALFTTFQAIIKLAHEEATKPRH